MHWVGWMVLLVAFAPPVSSQTAPPATPPPSANAPQSKSPTTLIPRSHDERERDYRTQHRIILDVEVTDPAGMRVTDLGPEDFTLLDGGQPRSIVSLRAVRAGAPSPAQVIILLDGLNDSPGKVASDSKLVARYLSQTRGHILCPTSIAVLSDDGVRASKPSRDSDVLIAAMHRLTGEMKRIDCPKHGGGADMQSGTVFDTTSEATNSGGSSSEGICKNARFQQSISALNNFAKQEADIPGRVILIWTGAGWPLLNGSEFHPDTDAMKRSFFDYLVDLSTALQVAQVTLDAVYQPEQLNEIGVRPEDMHSLLNSAPAADQARARDLSLPVLSHQTGGQMIVSGKDIAKAIASCIADAESYYVLSFDSPAAAQFSEYHALQVKVNRPGVTVRTNTSYYALP